MNCDGSTSLICTTNRRLNNRNKKSKKKKRKNRTKNPLFKNKKKYQKNSVRQDLTNSHNFDKSPFRFSSKIQRLFSRKIMSNWYWSNYKKAVEWQNIHKIAHWKACALALQEENKYLMEIINSMVPGMCPKTTVTQQILTKNHNFNNEICDNNLAMYSKNENKSVSENDDEEDCDDNIEFEMSEEMIQFFEQSHKHKMNLRKLEEENESQKIEKEVKQIQSDRLKRSEELKLLYGEQSSMITGMETAVQLSFNKYCDTKSPKYWPNIPLKL